MVTQPNGIRVVGDSNPSLANSAPPPPAALKVISQDLNRRLQIWSPLRYHWTASRVTSIVRPHCL